MDQPIEQPIYQPIGQVDCIKGQLIWRLINQLTNQDQLIERPIAQTIDSLIKWTINQLIEQLIKINRIQLLAHQKMTHSQLS